MENRKFVMVETMRGFEVWQSSVDGPLIGVFTVRADAETFINLRCPLDTKAAALEIAESFPELNLTTDQVNPDGELVLRIESILARHYLTEEEKN